MKLQSSVLTMKKVQDCDKTRFDGFIFNPYVGVKPLQIDEDALKLAKLGSKNGAIDVYVEHEDIDGNEHADEAVQLPLDELVDSLLDSSLNEPVDDETGSEGHNSDMNVDAKEDDDAWLHERDEDEEDDDHEWLYKSDEDEEENEGQGGNGAGTSIGTTEGNGAGISVASAGVNDIRKNVRNCAGKKNGSNGSGTFYENGRDGNAESSNEGSVSVTPASGHKNGNSTGEVHWDSDELVSLASSDQDRDTLTIPTYSSMGDQLELYVGMKFSSQAAFKE
ncbi:hypothetical protein FEM48_Zijuj01G0142000 [Ziziphus jujuba var. spinosa]|uniref:Uncharacterized protein n=1 Tax=Ziziphus jujuba var. spinosa TaxID=714518 RepID=A0A978W1R1_ZIZJJ|nr:hypothetical protein FEM48_Zijuj01G0142000 [Ziziphus jujuba var. spinosa]